MNRSQKVIQILEGFKLGKLGAGTPKTQKQDVRGQEQGLKRELDQKLTEIETQIEDLKGKHYKWFFDILDKSKHKIPLGVVEALKKDPDFLFRDLTEKHARICYEVYARHEAKTKDSSSDLYREKWQEFFEKTKDVDWEFGHSVAPLIVQKRDLIRKFNSDVKDLNR
jgi:hypothetical protein